jgi:PBP1b-binding outer membrane lipoprotein LpoB
MKAKKYLILTIWSLIFYGCSENANDEEAAKRMQNFVINISKYAR